MNIENAKIVAVPRVRCHTDIPEGAPEVHLKQQCFSCTLLVNYFFPLIFNLDIIKTAQGIYFKNLTVTFQQKNDLPVL